MTNDKVDFSLPSNTLLFPEEIESKLYLLFKEFQLKYGSTYMFFSYEHMQTKVKFVFQTDPEWNTVYIENGFIADCPIIKRGTPILAASPNQDVLLKWDMLLPENAKEKRVVDSRKDHNIFHGLSVVKEENGIRKMFGIATDKSNKNFERYLLNDYKNLQRAIAFLRKKCDKLVLEYFQEHLNS